MGRVPISPQAVGLVVHGIGDLDTPVALLTYSPSGAIVGGHVVGGEFGDMEYGYDGELAADGVSLSVNRYVWVGGAEKEYAEDLSFRLTASGDVERVIAP